MHLGTNLPKVPTRPRHNQCDSGITIRHLAHFDKQNKIKHIGLSVRPIGGGADVFLDRLRGVAPGSSGTDSLLTDQPSPLAQLGKPSGIAEEHSPTWHLLADEGRYASLNWEVFHSVPRYLSDAG